MDEVREPVPFEVYQSGVYLHGTKADIAVGEVLTPDRESDFKAGRVMNYVYFTETLDAATWGAEMAAGEGPGRIYIVQPTGDFEDDPTSRTRTSQAIRLGPSGPGSRCEL